jgi:hypothetical protein
MKFMCLICLKGRPSDSMEMAWFAKSETHLREMFERNQELDLLKIIKRLS